MWEVREGGFNLLLLSPGPDTGSLGWYKGRREGVTVEVSTQATCVGSSISTVGRCPFLATKAVALAAVAGLP